MYNLIPFDTVCRNLPGFGISEETTAATFGIEFPETPKYGSNEDIPALIILNPVKPNVEPMSNALWSHTLPTRQKIRKQTYSESDVPDQPDSGVIKPAKSMDAIDTMTRASDMVNKINDGAPMALLLPEINKKSLAQKKIEEEHEYDHLSPEDLPDGVEKALGSTGYVFLEPAERASSEKNQRGSSAPTFVDPEVDKDAIYLQPSSMPVPSQPPQHTLPTESISTGADTDGIYDIPKSSVIDSIVASMLASNRESTSSEMDSLSSRSKETGVEVPSHYDVPKSVLSAFRQEAPKHLGFSAQPNASVHEASQLIGSPLENHYDSLGSQNAAIQPNSPPYYDIPKHLLQAKSDKKLDNTDKQDDFEQETKMDDVEPLESSGEHVYCVPPDVVMNTITPQKHKQVQAKSSKPNSDGNDGSLASPQHTPLHLKSSKPDSDRTDVKSARTPQQHTCVQVKPSDSDKSDTSLLGKPRQQITLQEKSSKPDSDRTNTSSPSNPQQCTPVQVNSSKPRADIIDSSLASKRQQQRPLETTRSKPDSDGGVVVGISSTGETQQQKPVEMKVSNPDSGGKNATNSTLVSKLQQHKPVQGTVSQPDPDRADGVNFSSGSKPVPMKRKRNEVTQRNSVVPPPRPAKRPTNLAKTSSGSVSSSLEDLLQEPAAPRRNAKITTKSGSKPAVTKKPKVLPKNSLGSAASSSEDLLQEPDKRNGVKVSALKPAVAKKPKVLPKNSSGSVTSSQEELLREAESREDFDAKNGTVNGVSERVCNSPFQEELSKSKPKIIPRSQSRQAIVQELAAKETVQKTNATAATDTKSNMSAQSAAPKRPPKTQKPMLKVPANS